MAFGGLATTQGDQSGLELPIRLAFVAPSALASTQRRLQALFDETLFGAINLAHADVQNLGDILAPDSPIIPFAFIAIEQDQGVDHLLGFMRTLAGYRFQFLPLLFLQRYLIAFHLLILSFRLRQEGKLSYYMRQFIRDITLEHFALLLICCNHQR